jgi:hypothetical protein
MLKSGETMIGNGSLFGWITVFLYLALCICRAIGRDWRTSGIALTFAVSNWLIFCFRK